MTMPHLMNCPHSSEWCLDCVKKLHDEKEDVEHRLKISGMVIDEFLKKTEWVQEKSDWLWHVLGQHRCDVINKYIKYLEDKIERAKTVLS